MSHFSPRAREQKGETGERKREPFDLILMRSDGGNDNSYNNVNSNSFCHTRGGGGSATRAQETTAAAAATTQPPIMFPDRKIARFLVKSSGVVVVL